MQGSEFFNILLILLSAALGLSMLARRFNFPPAIIFILGGGAIALTPGAPTLQIEPELILTLFLPPLLQSSAYFIVWREFKENFRPIMLLAIGAVFFTTLIVGLTAHALLPDMPLAAGLLTYKLISKLRDPQLTIIVSFLLPWGTYLCAEKLETSGVIAVVTASLILGRSQHMLLDAQSRLETQAIWRFAVFFMEATIFILIGMALRNVILETGGLNASLLSTLSIALIVTLSAIAARFLWVFAAMYLPRVIISNFFEDMTYSPISIPIMIGWAGMRGVVSLAIALALPTDFPQRDFIIITAFMITSITVIFQGGTLTALIKWMKIEKMNPMTHHFIDAHHAREKIYEASSLYILENTEHEDNEFIQSLLNEHKLRTHAYQRLQSEGRILIEKREAYFVVARSALSVAREKLVDLHRSGDIHDITLHTIGNELDLEESRLIHLSK